MKLTELVEKLPHEFVRGEAKGSPEHHCRECVRCQLESIIPELKQQALVARAQTGMEAAALSKEFDRMLVEEWEKVTKGPKLHEQILSLIDKDAEEALRERDAEVAHKAVQDYETAHGIQLPQESYVAERVNAAVLAAQDKAGQTEPGQAPEVKPCPHLHLNMEGYCHSCGADRRGV
jgi:hypothetical protein